ncbi:hypothetical protein [Streptomyces sp. NPDC001970]
MGGAHQLDGERDLTQEVRADPGGAGGLGHLDGPEDDTVAFADPARDADLYAVDQQRRTPRIARLCERTRNTKPIRSPTGVTPPPPAPPLSARGTTASPGSTTLYLP